MKILNGKLNIDDYNKSLVRDKKGNTVSISFPIESFYNLIEDIEDFAFIDGQESDKSEVSHKEVLKAFDLTSQKLKKIRKKMNLNQKDFAERIGYAEGTVRNIETDQNKITSRFKKAVLSLDY